MYFFQAGIGILANTFLLLFHIFTIHQMHRLRPTDMITCQLAFVHLVMLLIALDIASAYIFKSLGFPNELNCKAMLYMSRVSTCLSIPTTCLLSIVQVITISPSSFYLSIFKHNLTKHVAIAFFCICCLSLCSNSNMIIYTVIHSNRTNLLNVSKYCSLASINSIVRALYHILNLSQNVFFVEIMLLSSMYMVIFLCSHQRKSQYLCSMSISQEPPQQKGPPVLSCAGEFLCDYVLVDIIITSFVYTLWKYEPAVPHFQCLVGNIYATVSPLVFISSDKRLADILKKVINMCQTFQELIK